MPGVLEGMTTFLMTSTAQPDYVFSLSPGLPTDYKVTTYSLDSFFRDIQKMATVICFPHGEEEVLQFGTLAKPEQFGKLVGATMAWWNIFHGSNLVWAYFIGDPGEGGRWRLDRSITRGLE